VSVVSAPADKPDVTTVIPTKDRVDFLASGALPSALGQEGVEHEVIVVDDGSSDGTAAFVEDLDDERVRVIRHPRTRGVAHARNSGIAAARGSWVAFLDDDDLWSPDKLRMQIQAAETAGASFSYASALGLDGDYNPLFVVPATQPERLAGRLLAANSIWGGSSNVVARRTLLEALEGFDEQLHQLADWDLWIRLALEAPAAACPDVLVGIVQHQGSMLVAERADIFAEFAYLVAKHESARARLAAPANVRMFARWEALGHRRAGRRSAAARAYLRGAEGPFDIGAVARAAGCLLGERAMDLGARLARSRGPVSPPPPTPVWLHRYTGRARSARTAISSS